MSSNSGRAALGLSALLSIIILTLVQQTAAASGDTKGEGDENRDDPCTHLPDPPGNANGIENKCPAARREYLANRAAGPRTKVDVRCS
jgi:hypothetical protein